MFAFFKRKKLQTTQTKNYALAFRISFPTKNGYSETGVMNIVVPATSKEEAKEKLLLFAKTKVKTTVVNIHEGDKKQTQQTKDFDDAFKHFDKAFEEFNKLFKKFGAK